MKKLRVRWTPDINQDIDAITDKKSPFYNEKLTRDLIKKYGSIDNLRREISKGKDE
jgi:hypothetical protein